MKLLVIVVGVLLVMFSVQLDSALAATADECDPLLEEFTDSADCDYNCQDICEPITDVCLCRFGYLRDLNSGKCIPEDQCVPAPEEVTFGCLSA